MASFSRPVCAEFLQRSDVRLARVLAVSARYDGFTSLPGQLIRVARHVHRFCQNTSALNAVGKSCWALPLVARIWKSRR